MFIDPKKPLPIATVKDDYIGVVYNAIIEIGNQRYKNVGNMESLTERVVAERVDAEAKIAKFEQDTDADLKAHTNLRGPVHGETKESVGLGNVDNWFMANVDEHKAGQVRNKFAHPLGLGALVKDRLSINSDLYIRSRIIPLASGGNLGSVPQTDYRWVDGDVGDTLRDPRDYFTETGFSFSTENGVRVYPSMTGANILTQQVAAPGQPKTAITPPGGTQVRIYNRNIDIRRMRPSVLRGYSNVEPEGRLIQSSRNLFDRSALFYMEGNDAYVRSFNKVRLPFDILKSPNRRKNWEGIIENRENTIYNIIPDIVRGDLGWGDDIYFTIKVDAFKFTDLGIDAKNGPGTAAETIANLGEEYTTKNYTVPGDGKFHIYDHPAGGKAICIRLRDMIAYTDAQKDELWAQMDRHGARNCSFGWSNRLRGVFTLRIPIGFYSKDDTRYTSYYADFMYTCIENEATRTLNLNVTTLRNFDGNLQILSDNFQINKDGRFVEYNAHLGGNPFDPRVFSGTFDANGGHVRVYTLYNRQYVGYYQHNLDSPLTWINNGDNIRPTLEKFLYKQMSTINNDGLYGDHLRHIPVRQTDSTNEYITLTRDWLNGYRWCYTTVELDKEVAPVTSAGRNIGPKRIHNEWFDPPSGGIPSFVVSNEESVDVISSLAHVFNTQNKFKGYGSYTLVPDVNNPIQFNQVIDLDDSILNWIAINGGGWTEGYKQIFMFRGQLFWFSQTTSANEMKPDGTDCYYGVITNITIVQSGERTLIRTNGDVANNATVKPLKVNNIQSLRTDRKTITGLDSYDATDVYIMRTNVTAGVTTRLCMVNLGPFNNFYLPFHITSNSAGVYDINPVKSGQLDPIFNYKDDVGFNVDYDEISGYGSHTPDRLHPNLQSPVMLNKMMWVLGRTPGNYELISESRGRMITNNGIMSNYEGTTVYPVGSIVTVGGSNIPVKKPLIAHTSDYPNDELFVTLEGSIPTLYSKQNNPKKFPVEPSSGATPAGFTQGSSFRYYDIDGWKNSLLPVVDGYAMNFYGYGSSFPALMGTFGTGKPVNRFFLQQRATVFTWNTGLGRRVNIGSGSDVSIKVNGADQVYNGSGVFDIPDAFSGVVTIEIQGMSSYVWSLGLVEIIQFGSLISSLNFANCQAFKCLPSPPVSIKNYSGMFAGTVANLIDGMQNWNTSEVTNMSGMFRGAVNFNQSLNNWNTTNVTDMSEMFKGCTVYNQSLANWNTAKVENFASMFENAKAFNQALPWHLIKCWSTSKMFKGALRFNGNISGWDVSIVKDFSSMFEGCEDFNIALQNWRPVSATTMKAMFKNTKAFNSQLIGWDFPLLRDVSEMFMGSVAFNRPLADWNTTSWIDASAMFEGSVAFGALGENPLTAWNLSGLTNGMRMFALSNFNSEVNGWSFGSDCRIDEMFRGSKKFNQDVSSWDVQNVGYCLGMFRDTTVYKTDIVGWHLSSITSMASMFQQSQYSGDLVEWNIDSPNDIDMSGVFADAPLFNGRGIATWNTSNVIDMHQMFDGAKIFNQDITGWDVSKVVTMLGMFKEADTFNKPIGVWVTSSVEIMADMFYGCYAFNQPLNDWDVSKVWRFDGMFKATSSFNQPLNNWVTTSGRNMDSMFESTSVFNSDITTWDTSSMANANLMFQRAEMFNQDISGWNTSKLAHMNGMFYNAVRFNQDLSGWDVSQVTEYAAYADGATAWTKPKPNLP